MKIKFKHLLLSAAVAFPSVMLPLVPAHANDWDGCFMVDESGNTVSLGSLCGYEQVDRSSQPAGATGRGQASGQTAANGSAAANGVVQVPIIRRAGGTPVIAVSFNDSQTYEMILDTGASGTLITRRMANDLNLRPNGEVIASIADGSRVRFPTSRVSSIAVEAARVSEVDVAIAEDMEIGLLGHDFFGNYDIRIGKDIVEFTQR